MEKLSHKDFESYWKVRSYIAESGITEEDLNEQLFKEIMLEIRTEDDDQVHKFLTLQKAAKFIKMSRITVEYSYCSKRTVITCRVGGVSVFRIN